MRERRINDRGQDGLTLIELVVAMSVFALIAVMGLQALTGSLRMRDRLADVADTAAALSLGTSLLRHDLQAMVPMFFYPAGRGAPQSAVQEIGTSEGFGFSVSTDARTGAPLGRVEWRFDAGTGTLLRKSWPTLYPVSAAQATPEVAVWQGVTGLQVRSYWDGAGWVEGIRPPLGLSATPAASDGDGGPVAVDSYSDALPLGLEITVLTQDYGPIALLESVK